MMAHVIKWQLAALGSGFVVGLACGLLFDARGPDLLTHGLIAAFGCMLVFNLVMLGAWRR